MSTVTPYCKGQVIQQTAECSNLQPVKYVNISRGTAGKTFSQKESAQGERHQAKEATKQSLQLFALFGEFTSKVSFYITLTYM